MGGGCNLTCLPHMSRATVALPPTAHRPPPISVHTHTLAARVIFVKTNMATQRMRNAQAARLGTLEQLFKAMADQTRLRILALLAGGEVCVCDIHETLGIPQPRASRHLAYLRRTGLVLDRKEGLWVYYRLADPDDPVLQTLLSAVVHCLGHVPGVARESRGEREQQPAFTCCGAGAPLLQVARR